MGVTPPVGLVARPRSPRSTGERRARWARWVVWVAWLESPLEVAAVWAPETDATAPAGQAWWRAHWTCASS